VPPTTEEAIKDAPTPPPIEEQLLCACDVEDLKHAGTDAGEGSLRAAIKGGIAGDVVRCVGLGGAFGSGGWGEREGLWG